MTRFVLTLFLTVATLTCGQSAHAANRWVGGGGNNNNSGIGFNNRWATVTFALSRLEPGDTLTIANGSYDLQAEGATNGVAAVRRQNGGRVDGWTDRWTIIRAQDPRQVFIRGNIDVEGSFIRFEDLRIFGDLANIQPGLFFRDSHHIDVINNEIAYCGGGGINFNHCDSIRVISNQTHHNGHRNPDQHSGISVYQPISQVEPEGRYWRIEIRRNSSYDNMNLVPTQPNSQLTTAGNLTDGNGIILDDYHYTQTAFLGNRADGVDEYPHRTLVEGNICNYNGGSGVQVFEANLVTVKNNTCIANVRHVFNSNGDFLNRGQVSLQNANDCHVLNNVLQSRFVAEAPGNSPFAASESNGFGNFWQNNLLHSTVSFDALWNNANIDFNVFYVDPQFRNEQAFDYTSIAGENDGVRWDNHTYTDLNGTVVGGNQSVDLGALQN